MQLNTKTISALAVGIIALVVIAMAMVGIATGHLTNPSDPIQAEVALTQDEAGFILLDEGQFIADGPLVVDFEGDGVTASGNTTKAIVTIPGGSGGTASQIFRSTTTKPDSMNPGTADTDSTSFLRFYGVSGYSPITDDDVDQANPTGDTITQVSQWRGGGRPTSSGQPSTDNTFSALDLPYTYTTPVYLWFGLQPAGSEGLSIDSVTLGGVDVPIEANDDNVQGYKAWRSTGTYMEDGVEAGEVVLTLVGAAVYNRYAVVNQSTTATESEFLDKVEARTGSSSYVNVPTSGWVDNRGRLHIALPADQPDPTVFGEPGGLNLHGGFTQGTDITINGVDMQVWASPEIYQIRGGPLWMVE